MKGYIQGNWHDDNGEFLPVWVSERARRFGIPGTGCTVVVNEIKKAEGPVKERPMHVHPHEQIMLIVRGNGELVLDGERYPMKAGGYFVIPANVPHRFDASQTEEDVLNIDIFYPTRNEYVVRNENK